jgi:hypothetical protein
MNVFICFYLPPFSMTSLDVVPCFEDEPGRLMMGLGD